MWMTIVDIDCMCLTQVTVESVDGVVTLPDDTFHDVIDILFSVQSGEASYVELSDLQIVGCMTTGKQWSINPRNATGVHMSTFICFTDIYGIERVKKHFWSVHSEYSTRYMKFSIEYEISLHIHLYLAETVETTTTGGTTIAPTTRGRY